MPLHPLVYTSKDEEAALDSLDSVSTGGGHKSMIEERWWLLKPFLDGVNDALALKWADVGFVIGISDTQLANDAADIIFLNENFAYIVTAAKWGHNVHPSLQILLQFRLTVNIIAVTTALVGSFAYHRSPLAAIQLLWVKMLMSSLASLALASESDDSFLLPSREQVSTPVHAAYVG